MKKNQFLYLNLFIIQEFCLFLRKNIINLQNRQTNDETTTPDPIRVDVAAPGICTERRQQPDFYQAQIQRLCHGFLSGHIPRWQQQQLI
jgi:hypothetical protein